MSKFSFLDEILFSSSNLVLCVMWQIVVNAIVDTLKTAFPRSEPQSPTDDIDAEPDGKLSIDKKSKYDKKSHISVILIFRISSSPPCFYSAMAMLLY